MNAPGFQNGCVTWEVEEEGKEKDPMENWPPQRRKALATC